MDTRILDWKDVANSQFDKAFTLAVLFLLFAVMVTPRLDVQKQKFSIQQMQAIELPPEEIEKLKPPEESIDLKIDVVIDDNFDTSEVQDPSLIEAALKQLGLDINKETNFGKTSNEDRPFEFVPYEDPPEPISQVAPEYPEFVKKIGVQGTVVLEAEVYRDGTLGKIFVKKSVLASLDEAAINAVKKWKFQPGKSGGKAVDTTVIIPIEFNLSRN